MRYAGCMADSVRPPGDYRDRRPWGFGLSPCSGGGGGEIWGCERISDSASDSACSQAGGGCACSGAMGFQSTQGEGLLERTGSGRARWGVAGDRVLN